MAFFSRIKKLASETAIYGISTIVGRMVNFLLVPLYVNFYDPDLYGIVVLVYTTFIILNNMYQHGMESAYLKYASGVEGRSKVNEVFSTATWSLIGVSVCLSLALLLVKHPLGALIGIGPEWVHLFYYAAGILTLDVLVVVPFAELRLQNRPIYFAAIKTVNILLNVGFNFILIVGLRQGIESIFISNLIASAGTLLLLLPLYFRLWRGRFDGQLWRQLVAFGLPFLPSGLSYAFVDRINVIFLGNMPDERVIELYGDYLPATVLFSGSDATTNLPGQYIVGIFGAVWKLGVFMMLVAQMFRFAWQPFFLQHAEDEDAKPLFSRIFTLFTAASLFILLAVSFFIDDLVAIPLPGGSTLIRESYWFALYVVPIALLAYFFQGWYYNFTAGAYIEKQTRHFVVCTFVGALLALAINIFIVPYYGMTAAAWATTLAYGLMAMLLYFIVQRFYPVPYRWPDVIRLCVLAAGLFAVWYYYPGLQSWWREIMLLLAYLVGVVALRVVPWASVVDVFSRLRGRYGSVRLKN